MKVRRRRTAKGGKVQREGGGRGAEADAGGGEAMKLKLAHDEVLLGLK